MAFSRAEEFKLIHYLQSITGKVIAHPARIVILLYLIKSGNTPFCELNNLLPLARTTVSYHVRKLCEAKLIMSYQQGEQTYYEIDEEKCYQYFAPLTFLIETVVDPNVVKKL